METKPGVFCKRGAVEPLPESACFREGKRNFQSLNKREVSFFPFPRFPARAALDPALISALIQRFEASHFTDHFDNLARRYWGGKVQTLPHNQTCHSELRRQKEKKNQSRKRGKKSDQNKTFHLLTSPRINTVTHTHTPTLLMATQHKGSGVA